MGYREYIGRKYCARVECNEIRVTSYRYKRDLNAANKLKEDWLCSRHDPKSGNIQPDCDIRTATRTLTAGKSTRFPNLENLFWTDSKWNAQSGFAFGEGWNAHTEDFPEGAQIIVETKITVILPDDNDES